MWYYFRVNYRCNRIESRDMSSKKNKTPFFHKDNLVLRYCKSKDPELREKIVLSYKPLVEYISKKLAFNKSDLDDVIQVGTIGLLRSLERFEPKKQIDFSTFATPNIIGEIKVHP